MFRLQRMLKRLVDICGSFFAIILFSPILVIVALLVRLDSEGPIFFRQSRLGLNGAEFEILKFRTMIPNAESIGDGLVIKSDGDSRITKVGRFLRKTSLDELPQFFNVLNGSMSLVGPRPPVTYYPYNGYNSYPTWAKERFTFKPGITGLAQITVRNSVSWDDKIRIDIEYIDNYTIFSDFKILLSTFLKVLKSENIY